MRCPLYTCPKPELPPRARRIQRPAKRVGALQGTTSACAENTLPKTSVDVTDGNYLRVRGEYSISDAELLEQLELPPRARRIPATVEVRRAPRGTTSACAENTSPTWDAPRLMRNYLRVRGEYFI